MHFQDYPSHLYSSRQLSNETLGVRPTHQLASRPCYPVPFTLYSLRPTEYQRVNQPGHSQYSANDGACRREEMGECLACLGMDDFHG